MKKLVSLLVGLGLVGSLVSYGLAATTQDVTITVTPLPTLSLTISVTTYAFGNIDVNTSTNSATALTLTNQSNVSVTVDKKITNESDPSGWTAGTTAGANTYVLYCATAAARIGLNDFALPTKFGAVNNETNLTNAGGTSDPVIAATGSVALWFKLDMPTTVSDSTARTITTRFTAVVQ